MSGFTAADAVGHVSRAVGRPVDVVLVNDGQPARTTRSSAMRSEHKELLPVGTMRPHPGVR